MAGVVSWILMNFLCLVNGGWSPWSSWSPCSVNCGGGGTKSRTRECNNPSPQHGGENCKGEPEMKAHCGTDPCPGEERKICLYALNKNDNHQSKNFSIYFLLLLHKTHADPCTPNPCYEGVECEKLSDTEYECGNCPEGMEGNGKSCSLVNEVCMYACVLLS